MSNPLDDPKTGEFSDYGRTGWDLACVFWVALMIVVTYGLAALVAWAIREMAGG